MIDIVIPYTTGGEELKYCLQGISIHMINYRKVYIIGDKPSFDADYIHIPETDRGRGKQDNIRLKIETACGHPDISDPFLFMNDDYFLLKEMDATKVNAAYNKTLPQAYHDKRKIGSYKQAIQNTIDLLGSQVNHFDIHYPIRYSKEVFIENMRYANWHDWSKRDGFVIKTLYCKARVSQPCRWGDFQMDDPKLKDFLLTPEEIHEVVKDWPMFSTDENSFSPAVIEYLNEIYEIAKVHE